MKVRCSRNVLCLVAVLSLQALAFGGATGAAVMHSSGTVALNGSAAPTTTALFKGDKVETADGGVATISSPGSTILIPSNSHAVFNGSVLELTAGAASISTTKGMAADLDEYLIAPANGDTAKFEVKKTGASLLIHASSGAVSVSAPENTFTLPEGATATLDSATEQSVITSPKAARVSHPALMWTVTLSAVAATGVVTGVAASQSRAPFCSANLCNTSPPVSPHSPCVCLKQ